MPNELSEREFMDQVCQLAEIRGWMWAHFRPAQNRRGKWQTPVAGPLGAGWPDLVLVRPRDKRIVFVELKVDGAKPTITQEMVLDTLHNAGAVAHIWRPGDWPVIEATLR